MKGGKEVVEVKEGVGEKLLCGSPVMCPARVAAGVTICSDSSSSVTLSSRVTRLTSSVAASLFSVTLSRVTLFCVTLVTMFSVSASSVAGGTTRLGLGRRQITHHSFKGVFGRGL